MDLRIGNRTFGPGKPALIVAEISSNHGGSLYNAKHLIRTARWVGADAVKFQCYTPEELLQLRHGGQDGSAPAPWDHLTLLQLYQESQTPHDWFPELFAEAARQEILAFSSVFGVESLAFLESLKCPAYKIAAADAERIDFITAVLQTGKPLLASTNTGAKYPTGRNILLQLWCPPGYPPEHLDLYQIHHLDGFSCHRPEPLLGALAVANGAWIIEFHLKPEEHTMLLDDSVSLSPWQFTEMAALVRRAERNIP